MADFKEFLLAIGITTSTNAREKLKWAFKVGCFKTKMFFQFIIITSLHQIP